MSRLGGGLSFMQGLMAEGVYTTN